MTRFFPIKDLVRADYNPRIMPAPEMAALMDSIETHGFVEPIVVNINKERYGVIVGGHQRLTAVEKLIAKGVKIKGIRNTNEVTGVSNLWCIPAFEVDLTLEAEKQLNIGLNRIKGKFDDSKLYEMILEMKESPSLMTTGFREDEISRILDQGMLDEEEEVPDGEGTLEIPKSKLGEIYELGPHRLICGDSTDQTVYDRLFVKEKADMIWTDPPYNVAYKAKSDELKDGGKESIMNDDLSPEDFKKLIDGAFTAMYGIAKPGASFYICSGWQSYTQFVDSLMKNGFYHSALIIWVKPGGALGWQDYKASHEQIISAKKPDAKTAQGIIYGWKAGTHTFFGDNEYDVWEMPRKAVNKYLHPTEKPDWLPMRAIRNSSKRGDIILDPFGGSGSVMAAAEKTGRRAFMIELDPQFCDVIRARWEKLSKAKISIEK